jgi:hypothetical protein
MREIGQVRQVIRVGTRPMPCIGWIPDGVVRAWLLWLAADVCKECGTDAESDRSYYPVGPHTFGAWLPSLWSQVNSD